MEVPLFILIVAIGILYAFGHYYPWPIIDVTAYIRLDGYETAQLTCQQFGYGYASIAYFSVTWGDGMSEWIVIPFQYCRDYSISDTYVGHLILAYRDEPVVRERLMYMSVGGHEILSYREAFILRNIIFLLTTSFIISVTVWRSDR